VQVYFLWTLHQVMEKEHILLEVLLRVVQGLPRRELSGHDTSQDVGQLSLGLLEAQEAQQHTHKQHLIVHFEVCQIGHRGAVSVADDRQGQR